MLEFKRTKDLNEYKKEFDLKYFDNPEYKYLYLNDYVAISNSYSDYGWNVDGFEIYYNQKRCGYISFCIDIKIHYVSSVSIGLEEEYLNSGLGVRVLKKFLDYCFEYKICFSVATKNTRGMKIYKTANGFREVGIRFNDTLTPDMKLCDMYLGKIINENV